MKSVRDIVKKMPETRDDLENRVFEYSLEIRDKVEGNPEYRNRLEQIVDEEFRRYEPYIKKGVTGKLGGFGHVVGYAADAYFFTTGDIVGTLGGKFLNLILQIPEKFYKNISYAIHTNDYLAAVQNIVEGFVSYLPGLTVLDQGLSRIAQKKMVSRTLYRVGEALGVEIKPWYSRVRDKIKDKYKDVEDRAENIISPRKSGEFALAAA